VGRPGGVSGLGWLVRVLEVRPSFIQISFIYSSLNWIKVQIQTPHKRTPNKIHETLTHNLP
jgi:hypothetical protein